VDEQIASLRETLDEMENDPDEFAKLARRLDGRRLAASTARPAPLRKPRPTSSAAWSTERNAAGPRACRTG
jgi:hypothetical protein